jgi:hypothetical protein
MVGFEFATSLMVAIVNFGIGAMTPASFMFITNCFCGDNPGMISPFFIYRRFNISRKA